MMETEWSKVKRKKLQFIVIILIPLLINGLLMIDLKFRYGYLLSQKEEIGLSFWQLIFKEQNIFMINELLTVFCTLFVYIMFSIETKYHGWVYVKMYQKPMISVVVGKYVIVILLMAMLIALNCLSIILVGRITGVNTPVEWRLILIVFVSQCVTVIGVTAINFLLVALISKIVYLIPISLFLFMFAAVLRNVEGLGLNDINPYSFATLCYLQSGEDVVKHAAVAIVYGIVSLIASSEILVRKDELA